jgi:NADH:ubiquinone oxidoreductase subunit E
MIDRFNDFLAKEHLQDKVELKGAFCMERCGEGINWKINDEIMTSRSVEKGATAFRKKVLEALRDDAARGTSKRSRRRKT